MSEVYASTSESFALDNLTWPFRRQIIELEKRCETLEREVVRQRNAANKAEELLRAAELPHYANTTAADVPDAAHRRTVTLFTIDPRRITDRLFGGPYFGEFRYLGVHRIKCVVNGDIFDARGLHEAWEESRNLAPIIYGDLKLKPPP